MFFILFFMFQNLFLKNEKFKKEMFLHIFVKEENMALEENENDICICEVEMKMNLIWVKII